MNTSRRTFLKIILIGGGTFIVGKILGPLFSKFAGESLVQNNQKKNDGEFRVIDDENKFSVFDEHGEEVLQIDKGA